MSGGYVIAVQGLSALSDDISTLDDRIVKAAYRAINRTTDRARTDSSRRIREQVNLTASYLSEKSGRLSVTKRASSDSLEGVIRGRQRPTSLARYRTSGTVGGRGGVRVEVKPGFARFMRRAFLIRLNYGTDETQSNMGLAIRLRAGETIKNKKLVREIGANLFLLYAPSVDQVFRTVAEDVKPGAAANLETEFLRLLELDR